MSNDDELLMRVYRAELILESVIGDLAKSRGVHREDIKDMLCSRPPSQIKDTFARFTLNEGTTADDVRQWLDHTVTLKG